jgi:hypothetical protein
MTLLIAMPAIAPVACETQPELPSLTQLLQGAARLPATADWRSGVLAALGMGATQAAPPALVAARALPALPQGTGLCLATPVHAVAGISRMFLAPSDSFTLSDEERDCLRLAFSGEFGAVDVQLHAAGTGWLLQAPFAGAALDADPQSLGGAALAREPATTAAARSLRRLGAEVEMWLATLPLNQQRERRGAPPVNSFWFWSGVRNDAPALPAGIAGGLCSNVPADAWLAGLAAHCRLSLRQVSGWDEVDRMPDTTVILQPPGLGSVRRLLPDWEAAWFEPVRRELAARRLPSLRLQIGRSAWQLPAPRLTRWLRRAQPWWQAVSA